MLEARVDGEPLLVDRFVEMARTRLLRSGAGLCL